MSRVFAYARVSTVEQLTENQLQQITQAGYAIDPKRYIEEKVSGSVPASQRAGFKTLQAKLEAGDTLVVTKLDRIGRDSIDVQQTVEWFLAEGIRLVVLQLGNLDLTSSAGALMVKMLAAVADFERDLIIERTQAGQARARAAGTHMGRPAKTSKTDREAIMKAIHSGSTISSMAAQYSVSRATIINIRDAGNPLRLTGVPQCNEHLKG
jgi:putative DNA-invertase from lambdoid prophage Rac